MEKKVIKMENKKLKLKAMELSKMDKQIIKIR